MDDVLGVFDDESEKVAKKEDPLEALGIDLDGLEKDDEDAPDLTTTVTNEEAKPITLPEGERPSNRKTSPRASRFSSLDEVPGSVATDN